jgi:hypothetical protein
MPRRPSTFSAWPAQPRETQNRTGRPSLQLERFQYLSDLRFDVIKLVDPDNHAGLLLLNGRTEGESDAAVGPDTARVVVV